MSPLVRDLTPAQSYDKLIGGLPVRLPSVDISTIGAGGGSIAWFDRDDRLKVGPISSGADPGPACYGLGGDKATVTDANLVLGRLSPAGLLDGSMQLDRDLAATPSSRLPTALDLHSSAPPMVSWKSSCQTWRELFAPFPSIVATTRANCRCSPSGAGGPLHASAVASSLEMREVIVPPAPGILCAAGLNASDLKEDFVRTVRLVVREGASLDRWRQPACAA